MRFCLVFLAFPFLLLFFKLKKVDVSTFQAARFSPKHKTHESFLFILRRASE